MTRSSRDDGAPEGAPERGLYPMRLVTKLTGLSADTIRAWERRYGAIEPRRSAGNTRRFSAEDVRRLVLLREATARGHAISSVAKLGVEELEALVGPPRDREAREATLGPEMARPASSAADTGGPGRGLSELRLEYLEAVGRFDARGAYEILMRAATFLDRRELVFEVVLPIVREVGARWSRGQLGVAQEHMVTSQLRSVLSSMLRFAPPASDATQVLLTTPSGHRHELGILVAALLAASRGIDPLYLGPDLPADEIHWAVKMSRARAVVLSIARDVAPAEAQEIPVLVEQLTRSVEVWIGLPREHLLARALPTARIFHDFGEFDAALQRLGSA